MRKINAKVVSLILIMVMVFSNINFVFATSYIKDDIELLNTNLADGEDEVTVIVELNDKSLLEYDTAKVLGAKEFLSTYAASEIREDIIKTQDDVQLDILTNVNENAIFKYSYTNAINGFVAIVKLKDIEMIKNLDGVKNVFLDVIYDIPEPITENVLEPKMATSKQMINLPIDLSSFPYKGEKTVVAIVDSGVDVNHELMKLSDENNVRLKSEDIENIFYQLNAAEYSEKVGLGITPEDVYYSAKFPFCFDYGDTDADAFARRNDHGVHVAGTVGANGTAAKAQNPNLEVKVLFDGVARETQILGMKVFHDKKDGAAASNTIAAVEDAITLGADAINLSLGSTAGFTYEEAPFDDYEEIFKKARDAGIIVAVASGNEDRMGLGEKEGYNLPYSSNPDTALVGSPAAKYHASTVASIENTNRYMKYIIDSSNNKIVYSDNAKFIETFDKQILEYVDCKSGTVNDFANVDVNDKIALIIRGDITFSEKVKNAEDNGAKGVIIYNHEAGGNELTSMKLEGVTIPAIFIGNTDGTLLLNAQDKTVEINIEFEEKFENNTAYQMSDFTSWGCSPDLKLKPEITAPGGDIYSTITNNRYESMSGTSMACPHIAGASALMQQYVKGSDKFDFLNSQQKADVIESLMMSTAKIIYNEFNREYSPRRQGAGLLDVEAATNSDVYLVNEVSGKTKIELGDKIGDEFVISFDVVNLGDEEYKYEILSSMFTDKVEHDDGYSLISYDIDYISNSIMSYNDININKNNTSITTSGSSITTGSSIITIGANQTVRVNINVEMDELEMDKLLEDFTNGLFVEGFIELMPVDKKANQRNISIPYMGYYGDWSRPPIFDGFYGYDNDYDVFYGADSYAYSLAYDKDGKVSGHYKIGKSINENDNYNWNWISISPDGDNYLEDVGMRANLLRNAKHVFVYILDKDKNVMRKISSSLNETYQRKSFYDVDKPLSQMLSSWDGKDAGGNVVEDGQYYYRIRSVIDYPGAKFQTKDIPVFVDTQKPQIVNIKLEDNVCKITATDNHYLKYASMIDNSTNKVIQTVGLDISSKENTFTFDTSKITKSKQVRFIVSDFAGNDNYELVEIEYVEKPEVPSQPEVPSNPGDTTISKPSTGSSIAEVDGKIQVPTELIGTSKLEEKSIITLDEKVKDMIDKSSSKTLQVSCRLQENAKDVEFLAQKSITKLLYEKGMAIELTYEGIATFVVTPNKAGELSIKMHKGGVISSNESYLPTKYNFDLDITIDSKSINNTDKAIMVQLPIEKLDNIEKIGVYTLNSNNELEYVMTYLKDDVIEFYPPHFSPYSLMIYDKTFDDIKGHWAKDFIEIMASKHIVKGKTEKLFAPEDIVTRAEFVEMVVRALNLKGEGSGRFSNISYDKWYANSLSLAKDAKLIEGQTYNAEGIISRIEMAKIISKAHALLNGKEIKFIDNPGFVDVLESNEDYKYIGYAKENGLINGYPDLTFRPVEDTSRAEAVKMIYKMLNQ